jgi:hypothetical protein
MQNLLSNSLTNSADFNQSGTIVNCIYVVVGKDPSTSITYKCFKTTAKHVIQSQSGKERAFEVALYTDIYT